MANAALQIERLTDFLSAYRASRANSTTHWTDRLPAFLNAWRHVRPAPVARAPGSPLLESARLAALLHTLRGPLAYARAAGTLLNPWKMAGLGRNEVRNAAVLSGFLSERLCGRLAIDFVDALLDPVRERSDGIPSRADLESGYHVRTEHCVSGGQRDRVDVTLEGREFVLGIEVKIDAVEGDRQLERYIETVSAWGGRTGKRTSVVFLAPFRPSVEGVPWITWDDVAVAARRITARGRAQPDSQKFLNLFVRHITTF